MSWDWENSRVDDYGGAGDKRDHPKEGKRPHAYGFYRMIQGALGSLYSKDLTGLLHAENLADARVFSDLFRAAEKLETNSFPSRADESLQYWVDTLGINVGDEDTDSDVRRKAQARYQSFNGNDAVNVETSVKTLLGAAFVSIHRNGSGSLDTPSFHTYWPGVNPGTPKYSLGGDGNSAWYSDNAHLTVFVKTDGVINVQSARRTFNVDLPQLLDDMLPAWATFNVAKEDDLVAGTGAGAGGGAG